MDKTIVKIDQNRDSKGGEEKRRNAEKRWKIHLKVACLPIPP